MAYSVVLGLGLPANLTALALLKSGRCLGQVLRLPAQPGLGPRVLYAHAAAMVYLLPGSGLLALPGGHLPRSCLLRVHVRGGGLCCVHHLVPLWLRAPARTLGGRPTCAARPRPACATTWLPGGRFLWLHRALPT